MPISRSPNVGGRKRYEPPAVAAALSEAIRRAGGVRALARAMGNISPSAISNWRVCPPARVLDVEKLTGVSRHRLRPDVFGPPPRPAIKP